MERTIVKRISAVVIALMVAFSMLYVSTGEVNAAGTWQLDTMDTYYVGMTGYSIWVSNWDDATDNVTYGTVTSAKSSNSKIIKIKKFSWTDENGKKMYDYNMNFKKAGKAKLTVKFKKPDGTTGTVTKTLKVKKYPNQIKSLKVNGKKVKTSKGAKRYEYTATKYKKNKAYVKIALKKGWKVSDVYVAAYNSKNGKYKEIKVKKNVVTKGKAIKIPKGYDNLTINIDMQKGKNYIGYYVRVTKNKY